jgi:hypothetical protein
MIGQVADPQTLLPPRRTRPQVTDGNGVRRTSNPLVVGSSPTGPIRCQSDSGSAAQHLFARPGWLWQERRRLLPLERRVLELGPGTGLASPETSSTRLVPASRVRPAAAPLRAAGEVSTWSSTGSWMIS